MLLENVPSPNAMEVGPDGLLYFPVMGANEIWRIDPDGGEPERVAGRPRRARRGEVRRRGLHRLHPGGQRPGAADRSAQRRAHACWPPSTPGLDNLTFVGDRLFVSNFTGEITEILGGGETRTVLPGGLNWPLDLAVGDDGTLYVADGTYFYALRRRRRRCRPLGMLFTPGYPGFLRGVTAAGPGEFVVTTSNGQVARYRPRQQAKARCWPSGFDQLYGVAVAPDGSVGGGRTRHRPGAVRPRRRGRGRWPPG